MPRAPCRALLAAALLAGACGSPPAPPAPAATGAERPLTAAAGPLVVFLGDSLTAGLGLAEERAFPAQLGEMLRSRGLEVRIVNAGVSGDTTAGGASRIGWLLRQEPDLLVLELGANDGLRGLPPEVTERNLRSIIAECRERGVRVLLLGMKVPPSYGDDYARRFEELFDRIAAETGVEYVPFFLAGVAGVPEMNLGDGIHPNEAGHRRAAENLLSAVAGILEAPPGPGPAPDRPTLQ